MVDYGTDELERTRPFLLSARGAWYYYYCCCCSTRGQIVFCSSVVGSAATGNKRVGGCLCPCVLFGYATSRAFHYYSTVTWRAMKQHGSGGGVVERRGRAWNSFVVSASGFIASTYVALLVL